MLPGPVRAFPMGAYYNRGRGPGADICPGDVVEPDLRGEVATTRFGSHPDGSPSPRLIRGVVLMAPGRGLCRTSGGLVMAAMWRNLAMIRGRERASRQAHLAQESQRPGPSAGKCLMITAVLAVG